MRFVAGILICALISYQVPSKVIKDSPIDLAFPSIHKWDGNLVM